MMPFKTDYMKKWVGTPGPALPQALFKYIPLATHEYDVKNNRY